MSSWHFEGKPAEDMFREVQREQEERDKNRGSSNSPNIRAAEAKALANDAFDPSKPRASGLVENDYTLEALAIPLGKPIEWLMKPLLGIAKGQFLVRLGLKELVPLTKKTFGHTFTIHGDDATNFLINRAKGSGIAQGQFLDNQKAAKFILDNLGKTSNGATNIPIPKNFPARIIMPDGTFTAATHIRLVPGGGGVKTAYPLIP